MLDICRVDKSALMRRFYDLILPEQGYRVAQHKLPTRKGTSICDFAATNAKLCEIVQQRDLDGYDAYHACATFKEALNDPKGTAEKDKHLGRTQRNVLGAQSLWLDGDLHDPIKHRAFRTERRSSSWT